MHKSTNNKVETFSTYQEELAKITEKIKELAVEYYGMDEFSELYQDMCQLSGDRLNNFKYFMYDAGYTNGVKDSLNHMTKAVQVEKERLERVVNGTI